MITRYKIFEGIFNKGKEVYYTQTSVVPLKVKRLMKIIEDDWNDDKTFLEKNPVAFERFKGKLNLTEGHHRFEACLKLNNKEILDKLFETAYYYDITWEPKSFKKKIIKESISDFDPWDEEIWEDDLLPIGTKIKIGNLIF